MHLKFSVLMISNALSMTLCYVVHGAATTEHAKRLLLKVVAATLLGMMGEALVARRAAEAH